MKFQEISEGGSQRWNFVALGGGGLVFYGDLT